MALNSDQLAILRTELDADPQTLGYSGMDHPTAAGKLNEIGGSSETIDREALDGQELQMAVVISEYTALTDVARMGWSTLLSAGSGIVAVADQGIKDQIVAIWAGTTTLTNLQALQARDATRAEKVFDIGVSVTPADVAEARLL